MDDFNTIRLKRKTIENFKRYSKKVSRSYSETLDYMIAFFKDNKLSPYDTLNVSPLHSLTYDLNERTEAVVSILRSMEKTQLIPTRKLLERLFENVDDDEEEEDYDFGIPTLITENEELEYYRNEHERIKQSQMKFYDLVDEIFNNLAYVHSHFGKDYYRLNLSKEELEEIKSKLSLRS